MRAYHGGPSHDAPNIEEVAAFGPQVFEKIADNLECYLKNLEEGGAIE